MECTRCGNRDHEGPFPYCTKCKICSRCHGLGQDVLKGGSVICEECNGEGFLKLIEERPGPNLLEAV